ncbi:MAG: adenylate/guanylate cyclase domain-containing protein [Actinobacteria bacterium]|nr:MAG: adenylate/guanylate cyclase domain-containing protein [Actinomycetota bacterium]
MKDPVDRGIRAIGRQNSYAPVWLQFGISHVVFLAGLGLIELYRPMSWNQFLVLAAVSQALVLLDNVISIKITKRIWRPVRVWERGARDTASTIEAWRAAATLPLEYTRRTLRRAPIVTAYLPFMAFATWKLGLPWYDFFVLAVVGTVVLLYATILRYFTMEVVSRPVLERIARELPSDFAIDAPGVSFTISFELVVLVMRSLARSMADLQEATDRIGKGDYTARVPVVATDESGVLAQSFNTMAEGLDERERLREAFGAYVDPGLAERVLQEGPDFEGEEVPVTVLFLDIRDFTAFAEHAKPKEVVALLNSFWELVVPVLLRHHGHANKFIGDGLLGVFGAPEMLPDHAERAVRAAQEIVRLVRERYGGEVGVGIGVNSGRVVAGTVGGGGRVEFTVIGDTVNTAARVEAATRETGDDVLITEATRAALRQDSFELSERSRVPLKGKREPARLWALESEVPVDGASRRQVAQYGLTSPARMRPSSEAS